MKIGSVTLDNQVLAAPLAGISDKVYRLLALEAGCGLVCTEMISAQALLYANQKTLQMLDFDCQKPLSVQLFGAEPGLLAEAAVMMEAKGADIIDINMGCPTPKIVKNGEGCALMQQPERAGAIVAAVAAAVKIPVTVKMRKGWDDNSVNAVELALIAEQAGAAAVTVHGRTRQQFYSGRADWDIIRQVKQKVAIPVIGNGDVFEPMDAAALLRETGCDGVMIGRASQGNPWIFRRTVHLLAGGELLPEPTARQRVNMALRHLDMLIEAKGELKARLEMRKHASWYTKGLLDAARLRCAINQTDSIAELRTLLRQYQQQIIS